jgi:hypothetical protein
MHEFRRTRPHGKNNSYHPKVFPAEKYGGGGEGKLRRGGDTCIMKRFLVGAALAMVLAGCAKNDSTNTSAQTTEPAGPATGVGAGAAASSGIGTASASGSTAIESQSAEQKPIPPAGTGAQNPTVNSNGVANTGSSTPQNSGSTR